MKITQVETILIKVLRDWLTFCCKYPTTILSLKNTIWDNNKKRNKKKMRIKNLPTNKPKLSMIYPPWIIILVSCLMISVSFQPFLLSNNNKVHDFHHFTIPKNSKSITHLKAPLIITVKVIPTFKILSSSISKKINFHLPNKNQKKNKDRKIKSEFRSNSKIKFNSTNNIHIKSQTIWYLMIAHNIS